MSTISLRKKFLLIPFGILVAFILIEFMLRAGGYLFVAAQEARNRQSLLQKDTYRILCVGESMTALGGGYSYPAQLEYILNEQNSGVTFSVINKGLPGITTTDIVAHMDDFLTAYQPDMVIAMMGINDKAEIINVKKGMRPPLIAFLKNLRIYKLALYIREHILSKAHSHPFAEEGEPPESASSFVSKRTFDRENAKEKEIETLTKAVNENPSVWAWRNLGFAYLRVKAFRDAKEAFLKAVALNPDDDGIYLGLAGCYFEEGDYGQAKKMYETALSINPANQWAYLGLARYYQRQGDRSQVLTMYNKALSIQPANYQVYLEMGRFWRRQGENDKSEKIIKKAFQFAPDNETVYLELVKTYKATSDYTKAEALLKELLRKNPFSVEAYYLLGVCYKLLGRSNEAIHYLKNALAINEKDERVLLELAWCFYDLRQYEASKRYIDETLGVNPSSDGAYYLLGRMAWIQRDREQARKIFEKVLSLNEHHARAHFKLGVYYRDKEEHQKAEPFFRKALTYNRKFLNMYLELAGCLKILEKYDEAEKVYKQALSVHPLNDKVPAALALLYEERGEYIKAKTYSQKAHALREEAMRSVTGYNYRRLASLLFERNLVLVCVSYPCRDAHPLKKILKRYPGVIFVDNESVFKAAIQKEGYREYFRDSFAGDFGHCTRKGNYILAKNVAEVIVSSYFTSR